MFLLVLERRRRLKPDFLDELKAVVNQTQDLSMSFQDHVQERVTILGKIMADLDAKIRSAEVLMKALEETSVKVKKVWGSARGCPETHQGGLRTSRSPGSPASL